MTLERQSSIVIPTFNRAERLGRAIESALSQTVPCEVLVVDHGSSDRTPEVARSYGEAIRYIRRSHDSGPFFAWLDGVVSASYEYVHLTYDDDWIEPSFMEACLSLMTDNCAFVFTDARVHSEGAENQLLFKDLFSTGLHPARAIEHFLVAVVGTTVSPGCGLFRRRDVLSSLFVGAIPMAAGGYHGAGPDLLMYLDPLRHYHRFGFVNRPLANFSAHPGSITISAMRDEAKYRSLLEAYDMARRYHLVLREAERIGLGQRLLVLEKTKARVRRHANRLVRRLRRVMKDHDAQKNQTG